MLFAVSICAGAVVLVPQCTCCTVRGHKCSSMECTCTSVQGLECTFPVVHRVHGITNGWCSLAKNAWGVDFGALHGPRNLLNLFLWEPQQVGGLEPLEHPEDTRRPGGSIPPPGCACNVDLLREPLEGVVLQKNY